MRILLVISPRRQLHTTIDKCRWMRIYSDLAPKDPSCLFANGKLSLSSDSNVPKVGRNRWMVEAAHQLPTYYTISACQIAVTACIPPPGRKDGTLYRGFVCVGFRNRDPP